MWIRQKDVMEVYGISKSTVDVFSHKNRAKHFINKLQGRQAVMINVSYLERRKKLVESIDDELKRYIHNCENKAKLCRDIVSDSENWKGTEQTLLVYLTRSIWVIPLYDKHIMNTKFNEKKYQILRTIRRLK